MGNKLTSQLVSIDSEPLSYEQIFTLQKQLSFATTTTTTTTSSMNLPFVSNVKLWQLNSAAADNEPISVAPLDLRHITTLSNSACYVVMHIINNNTANVATNATNAAPDTQSLQSLTRLLVSAAEQLTPRGLAAPNSRTRTGVDSGAAAGSVLPALTLISSSQPQRKKSKHRRRRKHKKSTLRQQSAAAAGTDTASDGSGLDYDVYVWRGRQTSAALCAEALQKAFELERTLFNSNRAALLSALFAAGNPEPITRYFADDISAVESSASTAANASNIAALPLYTTLYQYSHLFKTIATAAAAAAAADHSTEDSNPDAAKPPLPQSALPGKPQSIEGFKLRLPPVDASIAFPPTTSSSTRPQTDSQSEADNQQSRIASAVPAANEPKLKLSLPMRLPISGSIDDSNDGSTSSRSGSSSSRNATPTLTRLSLDAAKRIGTSFATDSQPTLTKPMPSMRIPMDQLHITPSLSLATAISQSSSASASPSPSPRKRVASDLSVDSVNGGDAPIASTAKKLSTGSGSSSRSGSRGGGGGGFMGALNLHGLVSTDADPSPTPRSERDTLITLTSRPSMSGAELVVHYRKICSRILDYVFLTSDTIARNKEKLLEKKITHIINAARVVCGCYFPKDFAYTTFHMYDAGAEAIHGAFLTVIDVIETARANGGHVMVHCMEGVSRSSALVLSYIMWRDRIDYPSALGVVKGQRPVCSPNAGFMIQLMRWEKMLAEPNTYLYRIAPLNDRYAQHRQQFPKLCNKRELDSRTCFVLHAADGRLFIWRGKHTRNRGLLKAKQFAGLVQKYMPRASADSITIIDEQSLPADFRTSLAADAELSPEAEAFRALLETALTDVNISDYATTYSDLDFLDLDAALPESVLNAPDSLDDEQYMQLVAASVPSSDTAVAALGPVPIVASVPDTEPSDSYDAKLFMYPKDDSADWEEIDTFDSEDLDSQEIYIVHATSLDGDAQSKEATAPAPLYVWIGADAELPGQCTAEQFGMQVAQRFVRDTGLSPQAAAAATVVQQDKEPKAFWKLFKYG